MTYYELCKSVCNYKTNEGIEKFCNFSKWYCSYHNLEFNKDNVKIALKAYKKKAGK